MNSTEKGHICRPPYGASFFSHFYSSEITSEGLSSEPRVASMVADEESDGGLHTPIKERHLEEYSEMGTFLLEGERKREKVLEQL